MKFFVYIAGVLAAASMASTTVVKTPGISPGEGNFELLILHNNDMHARFEQTSQLSGTCTTADREAGKCYGGFPRVAHVVKEARRAAATGEGPPVLYLNAGDTYTGTAWFTIYKWKIAAEFINALQPDAVSLGNHEFDEGVSGLTPFIENITCPTLAANLILNKEPTLQAEPNLMKSVVFDINGTKIGVIGYLTPDTKNLAIRNNVEYVEEVSAIRQEAVRLKNVGVNILIALGHSGFTKDLEIAEKVEDIDLVIGGHTNTFLWNGTSPDVEKPDGPYPTLVKQTSGRMVPAVQAYAYTKYLGKLNLIFDLNGEIISFDGSPELLDKSVPQDPDVLNIVNKYRVDVTRISEAVIGNTSVVLDGFCRIQECNLGNLITDAMIHKRALIYNQNKTSGWTDAPIAIIQGGGIRSSISHIHRPANITMGDLLIVLPFEGRTVMVEMNGSTIFEMLEHSIKNFRVHRPVASFLQLSGLRVVYNLWNKPGLRVDKALARCAMCDVPEYSLVNRTATYKVLMPLFLYMGGDGFSMFDGLPVTYFDYNELDTFTDYVRQNSPVYPAVEGRTILHQPATVSGSSTSKLSIVVILVAMLGCNLV